MIRILTVTLILIFAGCASPAATEPSPTRTMEAAPQGAAEETLPEGTPRAPTETTSADAIVFETLWTNASQTSVALCSDGRCSYSRWESGLFQFNDTQRLTLARLTVTWEPTTQLASRTYIEFLAGVGLEAQVIAKAEGKSPLVLEVPIVKLPATCRPCEVRPVAGEGSVHHEQPILLRLDLSYGPPV